MSANTCRLRSSVISVGIGVSGSRPGIGRIPGIEAAIFAEGGGLQRLRDGQVASSTPAMAQPNVTRWACRESFAKKHNANQSRGQWQKHR